MPFFSRPAAVVAAFSLAFVSPVVPQEPVQSGGSISTQVALVNLFATVRDKNKRIVTDLTKNDFKIFEDNEEQKVAFFSKEVTMPITLGMLIDTSPSEQYRLPAEQDAASQFVERVMKKGDEALVITFDLDVDLLSDFTDDNHIIQRAINKAKVNGGGPMVTPGTLPQNSPDGTHLYDAIYLACREKLAMETGRKALVIVTDAEDFGSKTRLDEAIEAAQRSDTVVHFLLVHDPGQGWRPDIAKKISDETGGRTIEVSSTKKLHEAFDQISEELRSQYQIGYYYPANKAKDGGFRKIKVDVANKDYKVLARRGFYAPRE